MKMIANQLNKTIKTTAKNDDNPSMLTETNKGTRMEENLKTGSTKPEEMDVNPFNPRMSLCRSPLRGNQPACSTQRTDDEDISKSIDVMPINSSETEGTSMQEVGTINQNPNITLDSCLEAFAHMVRYLERAKSAMKSIHEYAVNTKNVKGLLKEKSKLALNAMVSMSDVLGKIKVDTPPASFEYRHQGGYTPGEVSTNKLPKSKDAVTQTDFRTQHEKPVDGKSKQLDGNKACLSDTTPIISSSKRKQISPILQGGGKKPKVKDAGGSLQKTVVNEFTTDASSPTSESDNETQNQWEKKRSRRKRYNVGLSGRAVEEAHPDSETPIRKPPMGLGNPIRKIPNSQTAVIKKKTRQKGEALSIKLDSGVTFAEAVKRMKANAGDTSHGVTKMRRTQNGCLLVEFSPDGSAGQLFTRINGKMGEGVTIKRLLPKAEIEIRDIDPSVDNEEVLRALAEHLQSDGTDLNLRSLRATAIGLKLAIVEIPLPLTKKIEDAPRIKIGWTSCRIRILPRIMRCFNCHGFGHMAGSCQVINKSRITCRRCGAEGHKLRDCSATPNCTLCASKGKQGNHILHIAGSTKCQEYREALAKALSSNR